LPTSGSTATLGLYYYYFSPNANCTASSCRLEVGDYISWAGVSDHELGSRDVEPRSLPDPF
jgi:hypothetical protein